MDYFIEKQELVNLNCVYYIMFTGRVAWGTLRLLG